MLNAGWAQQSIKRSLTLQNRFWVASEFEENIALSTSALDQHLEDVSQLFKDDRTTTVAKLELDQQHFVLKRYNARNQWHKIKRAFRRSRARRCWQMSYAFAEAGLNVAQPILMLEKRIGPIRKTAYFINRLLPGQELLTLLPTMSDSEQAEVAMQLKIAFEQMSVAKLTHGDLKASNLIWSGGQLYFIDLDAAKRHRSVVTWLASHDKDRKRFLRNWDGQPKLQQLFERL